MLLLASPEIGSSSYTLFLLEEFLWGPLSLYTCTNPYLRSFVKL